MKYNYDFGTQFETKVNGTCTLIKYVNANEIYVMFEDGTIVKTISGKLLRGFVKNQNHPSVFGVGIKDVENINCHSNKIYILWHSIIRRAYSDVYHKCRPTYKDVEVCERWKRFSNFAKDVVKIPFYEKCITDDYDIDKDILSGDLKIYSPETCCFVPRKINAFFSRNTQKSKELPTGVTFNKRLNKYVACANIGGKHTQHIGVFTSIDDALSAYVNVKSKYLIEVANDFKGEIEDRVYDKLINYYSLE